ncbi:MAG: hypothetical protein PF448_09020 [Bacteroidales bacterium]|jgi:hypothetical protein|nr:hypothetical protein [Bacteroidales bacterium]
MKKSLFITMILLAGVFTFTSCDKTEEVEPGTNPTATIQGSVYVDTDLTNVNMEEAPQGTEIFFRINSQDLVLNPQAGYTYQTLQYKTTVGSDGTYSITLPTATHQAVNVTIQANQFEAQQTQPDNSYKDVVFTAAPVGQATQAEQNYFVDINYF